MRKLFIATFLCFISTALFSQIEKGAYQVGGNLSINQTDGLNGNSSNSRRTIVNTRGALFLNNDISTGILLNYSYLDQDSDRYSRSFGFGIYGRWHKSLADKFYFFLQTSISHARGKSSRLTTNNSSTRERRLDARVTPGLIYFLTKKVGLEVTTGSIYFIHRKSGIFDTKTNSYGIDMGLNSLSLGASIYL